MLDRTKLSSFISNEKGIALCCSHFSYSIILFFSLATCAIRVCCNQRCHRHKWHGTAKSETIASNCFDFCHATKIKYCPWHAPSNFHPSFFPIFSLCLPLRNCHRDFLSNFRYRSSYKIYESFGMVAMLNKFGWRVHEKMWWKKMMKKNGVEQALMINTTTTYRQIEGDVK